ncbi:hypothetical protein KEM52_002288 [Ascosphaera acerosa]|nr:hypothetical protein KEM52_002288 [Ascosphaera acerosa]
MSPASGGIAGAAAAGAGTGTGAGAGAAAGPRTVIEIRAPGIEVFALPITPQTTVQAAVEAFVEARGIAPSASVVLHFDGEALRPEQTFAAYEVEDHDMIDARVA